MKTVLITGGSGFIGTNLAHALASSGRRVRLLDNLSRPGVENNLRWLRETHGDRISIEIADVRDPFAVRRAMAGVETVFHFAAQVAVTTSLEDPIYDHDVNVNGTVNVLEAIDLEAIASKGYAFQVEMTYRAIELGFTVTEVPITFRERRAGASKMSRSIVLEAAWRVPRMRWGKDG